MRCAHASGILVSPASASTSVNSFLVSRIELRAVFFFFFKQTTAYEITEGDWSSDVCSSDLGAERAPFDLGQPRDDEGQEPEGERLVEIVRSEERRVGKECPQLCRSRWSP